jgi:hypothetical protein
MEALPVSRQVRDVPGALPPAGCLQASGAITGDMAPQDFARFYAWMFNLGLTDGIQQPEEDENG